MRMARQDAEKNIISSVIKLISARFGRALRIGNAVFDVKEISMSCQAKVEMSYPYQNRNVLFG